MKVWNNLPSEKKLSKAQQDVYSQIKDKAMVKFRKSIIKHIEKKYKTKEEIEYLKKLEHACFKVCQNVFQYEIKIREILENIDEHKNITYLRFSFQDPEQLLLLNRETLCENSKTIEPTTEKKKKPDILDLLKDILKPEQASIDSSFNIGTCRKCKKANLGWKIEDKRSGDEGYTVTVWCKNESCRGQKPWVLN